MNNRFINDTGCLLFKIRNNGPLVRIDTVFLARTQNRLIVFISAPTGHIQPSPKHRHAMRVSLEEHGT